MFEIWHKNLALFKVKQGKKNKILFGCSVF